VHEGRALPRLPGRKPGHGIRSGWPEFNIPDASLIGILDVQRRLDHQGNPGGASRAAFEDRAVLTDNRDREVHFDSAGL